VKAVLKNVSSPDVDLQTFVPSDSTHFGFLLEAFYGLTEGEGEDRFQFLVGTDSWLREMKGTTAYFGVGTILVQSYDFTEIKALLEWLAAECDGADWLTIATKLDRYGHSEFRDYKPAVGSPGQAG